MTDPAPRLTATEDGVLVGVRARPQGRCESVTGCHDGDLIVETRCAPERGKANEAIRRILADRLGIPRRRVQLRNGAAARRKRFEILGMGPEEFQRLVSLPPGAPS